MKKRGFTLVELLAVIVILAVVAIITVPMLLNVIEEARVNSAKVTATNYINYLEEHIAMQKLKGEEITDGEYEIIEKGRRIQQSQTTTKSKAKSTTTIEISMKGKLPHKGIIEIKNGRVTYAKLYVEKYIIEYGLDENGNPSISIRRDEQKKSTITLALSKTTKSITATVTCGTEGIENDTYKYKYKIDNGNYIESNSNIHTFNKLKANSKHKITAQCTNSTGGVAETSREITTYEIDEPTYELDTEEEWASKRTVTITYYGENLKNSYSIDGGKTWVDVTGNSVDVEFTSEGSIIARTTDGENIKTTSVYTVSNVDKTGPSDEKPSGNKTTKEITVTSNQKDLESGIKKVEYAIYKDNAWSTWQASNVFSGLKNNTTYKIKTRAENKAGIKQESKEESVTTLDIPTPTYSISGDTKKKTVTITYAAGYTHSYKKDNGSWVSVTGNSAKVEFTDNGTLIARSSDGKNMKVAATYEVDFSNPNIEVAYTYNPTSCVIGEESGCVKTTCYKNKASGSCSGGTIIKYKVNNTTTKYFYVLHDDGLKMTLQQRENTIYGKVWYGTSYSSSSTQYGPLVVLPALESATSSWSNVENQTYTMGTTNFNGTNAYTGCSASSGTVPNCTSNFYTMNQRTAKARMITVQEATSFGCYFQKNKSCPIWMWNYLIHSISSGGTMKDSNADDAYWTMSAYSSTIAYTIASYNGSIDYNYTWGYDKAAAHGARAVVVISK